MIKYQFTNDKTRRAFLKTYEQWGIWFTEPRLKVTYYRVRLPDKSVLVLEKQSDITCDCCGFKYPIVRERWHLIDANGFSILETRNTEVMDKLRTLSGEYKMLTSQELNALDKTKNRKKKE